MTHYDVISAFSISHLCDQVNNAIAEGYAPLGGMFMQARPAQGEVYYQAMVRQDVAMKPKPKNKKKAIEPGKMSPLVTDEDNASA